MIDKTKVPIQVQKALIRLHNYGYQAYLVGGAVRDLLLDKTPKDWDLATNAPLEEIEKLFRHVKIVGASFGVALVKIGNMEMQIARFRNDGEYSDCRHPDSVSFTNDIMEDLKRRDLTINSFAYDPITEDFIYTDGALFDLENKIIRTVGDPIDRFYEDALRMLRCVRFACQLDFIIDERTEDAIIQNRKLINNISQERIQEELNKILLSNYSDIGIIQLDQLELLKIILPEIFYCRGCNQNNYHLHDVFEHLLEAMKNVPNDLSMRLTALFHDIGKPATKTTEENSHVHFYEHDKVSGIMALKIMQRLKYDNQTIDEVVYLVSHHMELMNYPMLTNKGCRKLLNRHGEFRLRKLIEFRRADLLGSGTRDKDEVEQLIQSYRDKLEEVLLEKPATKFEDLAIDGNDIMEITGLKPCKAVGVIKQEIMDLVIENPDINQKKYLKRILTCYWTGDIDDIPDAIENIKQGKYD
jgi:tRNA nucleotidyltransferase (CCA-adding enzyme)